MMLWNFSHQFLFQKKYTLSSSGSRKYIFQMEIRSGNVQLDKLNCLNLVERDVTQYAPKPLLRMPDISQSHFFAYYRRYTQTLCNSPNTAWLNRSNCNPQKSFIRSKSQIKERNLKSANKTISPVFTFKLPSKLPRIWI
jgi:hypothetical protein